MNQITLKPGEYLWSERGTHVVDERGFAIQITEETTVTFESEEAYARSRSIIVSERAARGLDADGNPLPAPEPAPAAEESTAMQTPKATASLDALRMEIASLKSIIGDLVSALKPAGGAGATSETATATATATASTDATA